MVGSYTMKISKHYKSLFFLPEIQLLNIYQLTGDCGVLSPLQTRKMRLSQVMTLAPNHTTFEQEKLDSNPGLSQTLYSDENEELYHLDCKTYLTTTSTLFFCFVFEI